MIDVCDRSNSVSTLCIAGSYFLCSYTTCSLRTTSWPPRIISCLTVTYCSQTCLTVKVYFPTNQADRKIQGAPKISSDSKAIQRHGFPSWSAWLCEGNAWVVQKWVSVIKGKVMTLDRNPETMPKSINIVDLETEKILSEKNVDILNFLWALTFVSKGQSLIYYFCFIDKNKDKVLLVETTHWQINHTILLLFKWTVLT